MDLIGTLRYQAGCLDFDTYESEIELLCSAADEIEMLWGMICDGKF